MKKSYNKAFTLVELLAVIVILAIILVIAVPKIMDVINSSKKSTLETSVKMIASAAEKTKMQNIVLGKEDEEIKCEDVAKLNTSDYDLDNCTITFDTNNNASVTIKGKGKFEGLYVCGGTKYNAESQYGKCFTPIKYFTYHVEVIDYNDIIIDDVDKCGTHFEELYPKAIERCGNRFVKSTYCQNGYSIWSILTPVSEYSKFGAKISDDAELGIIIDDYDTSGGSNVIVPEMIDGYPVVGVVGTVINKVTNITLPDTIEGFADNREEYELC